jgi:small-conductance mechanosensitive channel
MDFLRNLFSRIGEILAIPILPAAEGGTPLTIGGIAVTVLVFIILIIATGQIKRRLLRPVLSRTQMPLALQSAVTRIFGYLVIILGTIIIMQSRGVDLTTLNVLAGAVGIGVGFGLQNIISNFISGLIILLERPIKVGDRIEVDDVVGDVREINARSTTVVTNDNIAIIVPNEKFISENVTNWSYHDNVIRFRIKVGVAYGSDTRLVERLLLQVAEENPSVLKTPPPVVRFTDFGDSALNFELRVFTRELLNREGRMRSELNFAIDDIFRKNSVEIPFPQRDIRIRSNATGKALEEAH